MINTTFRRQTHHMLIEAVDEHCRITQIYIEYSIYTSINITLSSLSPYYPVPPQSPGAPCRWGRGRVCWGTYRRRQLRRWRILHGRSRPIRPHPYQGQTTAGRTADLWYRAEYVWYSKPVAVIQGRLRVIEQTCSSDTGQSTCDRADL